MIYLFIISILFFQIYIFDFKKVKSHRSLNFYMILILLILISGLRYRIGVDTIRYTYNYEQIPSINNLSLSDFKNSLYEPLYFIMSVIAKSVSRDFVAMQLLHSLFINTVILTFIRKHTKYFFTGILFYFIFCFANFNFEVMRESVAISFFLLAYKHIISRNWFAYYIFVVFAILSHSAAFILIFIPFISYTSIHKSVFIYMGIAICVGYLIDQYFGEILKFISVTQSLQEKSSLYKDSLLASGVLNFKGILSHMTIYIFYPLAAIYFIKRHYRINFEYSFLILANIFLCIFLIFIGLFYRYLNYFIIFDLLIFSEFAGALYSYFKRNYSPSLSLLLQSLIFSGIFFLQIYSLFSKPSGVPEYTRYFPYSSVLDKEKNLDREKLFQYYNLIW